MSQSASCLIFIRDIAATDSIDQLFNDPRFLAQLRSEAIHNDITIFCIANVQNDSAEQRVWLERYASFFNAVHLIDEGISLNRWSILHWFNQGSILNMRLDLSEYHSDQTPAFKYLNNAVAENDVETTEQRIIYLRDALHTEEIAPADWLAIDKPGQWQDLLYRGNDDTIIFSDVSHNTRRELMEDVYYIRQHCGNRTRILVRECEYRIRRYDERLLMSAGATYIVPKALTLEELESLTDAFKSWQFESTLPELSTISELLIPSDLSGYQTPPTYVDSVTRMTRIATFQQVQVVLLKGRVAAGIDVRSVISRFSARRKGDICTTLGFNIYIFLFGCSIEQVDNTLLSLLGLSAGNLFADETRYSTPFSVREEMEQLRKEIGSRRWHDYSGELEDPLAVDTMDDTLLRYHPRPIETVSYDE